ncbi:MAG TPA: O-antigen ligase family protein, partial [Phycisphaerales bacterium]|nr:O-antigen ligase family protein [Phycisphaerales bacterium]
SAGLVAIALVAGALRVRPRRLLIRPLLGVAAMTLLSALLAWAAFGEGIRDRFDSGRREVVAAIDDKEFRSDTGARLLMAWWAIEALGEHPAAGVGLGGFEAWTRAHVEAQAIDPTTRRFHGHAHNAVLHAGATLGVPGLLIAVAFALLAVRGAAVRQAGDGSPGYADGPCFALVGLLLVSAFDSIQVNSHTAALLAVLMVFAVQQRPAPGR